MTLIVDGSAAPGPATTSVGRLVDRFERGLDAPICLTWELTYACNLACVHCLSSSGRRDPGELSTEECKAVIDEFEAMQIFYVNVGGGEPTIRSDFWELVDYATEHHVGIKFSTNGSRITEPVAARLAASDYVDVQISLDGASAAVNDAVRGAGSYDTAVTAMDRLARAGFAGFKLSVVVTRHNVAQLDQFKALADRYGAQLRLTRLRPSGRGADVWDELHPTAEQQRQLYEWLLDRGEDVLTGDSFFHLAGYGESLPGLNLCGAGRVVCLVDPVGDVYACPFAIHEQFLAGNVRSPGGFAEVWRHSEFFTELRRPQSAGACGSCGHYDACRGGCMAAKFFTGLPMDGPDPECVLGHGEQALAGRGTAPPPTSSPDHSRRSSGRAGPVPVTMLPARIGRAGNAGPATRSTVRRESPGRLRNPDLTASRRTTCHGRIPDPCSTLAESTWPEAAEAVHRGQWLLVPLGSTEQHGPHLPLSTDTDIAVAVAEGAAARDERLVVAPPWPTAPVASTRDFPGTLSIGQDATRLLLVELAAIGAPALRPDRGDLGPWRQCRAVGTGHAAADRGGALGIVVVAGVAGRCPRRVDRDVAHAGHPAGPRPPRPGRARGSATARRAPPPAPLGRGPGE